MSGERLCTCALRKYAAEEEYVGTNKQPCVWEYGCVDVDGSVYLGEVF